MLCIELVEHSRVDVTTGESVELFCNTSLTPRIAWTHDIHDDDGGGYVQYIYRHGHVDIDKPRLAVKSTTAGVHSLVISRVMQVDGGLYDCYDEHGMRRVGYQLVTPGMTQLSQLYTAVNAQYTPPTPTRRNCFVASASAV